MKRNDYEFVDYDKIINRQFVASCMGSMILSVFIVSFVLYIMVHINVPQEEFRAPYDMSVKIESIYRLKDDYYIKSQGQHNNKTEEHTFKITKHQFMQYKEGQSIMIHVTSQACYIIG